ncbi:hypothetical protein ACA910_009358 [Epithemia clementina (nom. ined.)]
MALYVYGNNYEGGGFLFYTLNKVMFVVLYFLVLVLGSYLSLRGTEAMAALFAVPLLVMIAVVHVDVNRTFVAPSTTLSLARACVSDTVTGGLSVRERKLNNFLAAKELERLATFDEERGDDDEIMQLLLPSRPPGMEVSVVDISTGSGQSSSGEGASDEEARRRKAIQEMERRYQEDDAETSVSDVAESDVASKNNSNFFIYRQPSLNRATWEVTPRPYRENLTRIINDETGSTITEEAELWG